jgi:hypothetical protein
LGTCFGGRAEATRFELFAGLKRRVRLERIEKAVGVLLVATGIAFLTGGFQSMSAWLIETFPQFGQVG